MDFKQHEQILDYIDIPVIVLNAQFKYVYVNEAVSKLTGIPCSNWIGKSEHDIFPKEQADVFLSRNKLVMKTGKDQNNEEQFTNAQGSLRTVITTKKLYETDSGERYILITARDITEEKEAKKSLQDNKQRFQMIAEHASDIIYVHDMNGNYKYVSPSVKKMRGYSPEELIGESVFKYLLPETVEKVKYELAEELENEKRGADPDRVRSLELHMIRKDGSVIITESKSTFIRDENGKPLEIMGIARDITEQRKMVEALAESEKRFQMIAENASDVIHIHSLDGTYKYVSSSVKKLRGYSAEELIGKSIFSFLVPETVGKAKKELAEELENDKKKADPNRVKSLELYMTRKDGSVILTESKLTFIRNEKGEPLEIMGIARDITERRKMEIALAESERKYHMLADNVTDVIFVFGLDLKYRYVSPSVEKMRGYTPQELIGKHVGFFASSKSFEEIKKTMKEELEKDMTGTGDPERSVVIEVEMSCKDGSTIWTEVKVLALRNEKGEATEILGISRDITERKRIENALRESEEKYRFLVEKINEAIIIVQDSRYVFCNKRTAEILGVSTDEIIGKPFLDYVFEEDREFIKEQHQERLRGMTVPNYDIRLNTATGKTAWVFISGTMIYYKGRLASLGLMTDITDRKIAEEEREKLIVELQEALSNVKVLSGLLPICASCKKIRNDKGYWEQIEMYVKDHSDADFSHGICPDCAKKLYPDFYEE